VEYGSLVVWMFFCNGMGFFFGKLINLFDLSLLAVILFIDWHLHLVLMIISNLFLEQIE